MSDGDGRAAAPSRRAFLAAAACAAGSAGLSGCGGARRPIVGSKDFTEAQLLGEMYAQAIEARGVAVHRRLGLGGTQVATAALARGSIDLYPEYTGTALLTVLNRAPLAREADVLPTLRREYARRYDARWLAPTPMNDSQGLALRRDRAAALRIATVSDVVREAPRLRLGAVPEFLRRADGLPALRAVYGPFAFADVRVLDGGLKYAALARGDVDVAVAFTTDGRIATDDLLVPVDDRRVWQAYHAAPVAREDALRRFPAIAPALDAIAPTLTDAVMRRLNAQVDGEKRDVDAVAREHLAAHGLLRAEAA